MAMSRDRSSGGGSSGGGDRGGPGGDRGGGGGSGGGSGGGRFSRRKTFCRFTAEGVKYMTSAEERAGALKDFKLVIPSKAGTEGKLFGSIGTADIAEAATKAGIKIERSEVRLPNGALRTIGDHAVVLHLHADIDVPLAV